VPKTDHILLFNSKIGFDTIQDHLNLRILAGLAKIGEGEGENNTSHTSLTSIIVRGMSVCCTAGPVVR